MASPCGVVNHRHVRARDRSAWVAGDAFEAKQETHAGKAVGAPFEVRL